MTHFIHGELLGRAVNVLVVGAGGTGSRVLEQLVCLHRAMIAKGHPAGLRVTLMDDDRVSVANVGRQAFFQSDVGAYKALTLVNRANMALDGVMWQATVGRLKLGSHNLSSADLVIGCVDNRAARNAILRCLQAAGHGNRYYLDLGNRRGDGQAVLGEVLPRGNAETDRNRLPHVGELFPELIDAALDAVEDDTPSCSLAEALEKQSLFINLAVSVHAMSILSQLFDKGQLENHGVFVNVDRMTVNPLPIDPEAWARFGVVREPERVSVASHSARKPGRAARRKVA